MREFLKAEALGNDFILRLLPPDAPPMSPVSVRRWCDRRLGVGGDGVIVLRPSAGCGRWRFRLYNADGAPAEISGNGLRCAAAALCRWWRLSDEAVFFETTVGVRSGEVLSPAGLRAGGERSDIVSVRVDMGSPQALVLAGRPTEHGGVLSLRLAGGASAAGLPVSMGNPHFVIPCEALPDHKEVITTGPQVEAHPRFLNGVNVMWMARAKSGALALRIWERGCGWTPACGSGACAAAWAAGELGWVPGGASVDVEMEGGDATVSLAAVPGGGMSLSGPARRVLRGEVWF